MALIKNKKILWAMFFWMIPVVAFSLDTIFQKIAFGKNYGCDPLTNCPDGGVYYDLSLIAWLFFIVSLVTAPIVTIIIALRGLKRIKK